MILFSILQVYNIIFMKTNLWYVEEANSTHTKFETVLQ